MESPFDHPPRHHRDGDGTAGGTGGGGEQLGVRLRPLAGGGTRHVPPNRAALLQGTECQGRGIDRSEVDLERYALLGHPRIQRHRAQGESGRGSIQVGRGRGAQHVCEQD